MVVGVDQYKRIRKMAAEEGLSQREIARRLGISRNTVARYCRGFLLSLQNCPARAKADIARSVTPGKSSM